jgi:zinc protease
VIGWPSDIKTWTLADLQQFFTTNYAPNNCTVVITGDVQPAEVIALAKQYFEPIPAQPAREALRSREPEQEGERRITLELPAQTPLLQFAYHAPQADDKQMPALELLLRILADGESSRLYQALVERDKVAIAVNADVMKGFDPGLAWFFLSLPADADVSAAEKSFDAELQQVIDKGVTPSELNKARNMVLSEFWQGLSTINGKAAVLGHYAVFHDDYRKLFAMPDVYAKVTTGDIQQVAQNILQRRNRTVGALIPVAEDEAATKEAK